MELDEAVGKNDGSVGDFRYFNCDADKGIFAPLSKIQRLELFTIFNLKYGFIFCFL